MSTLMASRTPHGRMASAIRLRPWIISGVEERRGSVYVVHVAAVDADGGEQPRVFADGAQVVAHLAVLKEDRPAAVAALDGAVGVVPLIDPANGHGGA